MRKVLLLLPALLLFAAACTGEPETVSIRLVDGFESAMVQGSPPASEPPSARSGASTARGRSPLSRRQKRQKKRPYHVVRGPAL